jgi:hypothetical protein
MSWEYLPRSVSILEQLKHMWLWKAEPQHIAKGCKALSYNQRDNSKPTVRQKFAEVADRKHDF